MRVPYGWLKDYLEIDKSPKEVANILTLAGHALDKPIFGEEGDKILDLEDRGNRADIMGIVGIARDLAALTGKILKFPLTAPLPASDNNKFIPKITISSKKVLRWTAVVLRNVKVTPSPKWLAKRLASYGIEPLNNVVDVTNFVMVELGMPLHAFDLDKVDEINLRAATRGESLVTFEGTKLELDENDLVAADSKKPLTLTTAIGGRSSGIAPTTQNILLEAGLYDQPTARRSALRLKIKNETSQRLGKYLHPKFCEVAIARSLELFKDILDVSPVTPGFDYYPEELGPTVLNLTFSALNTIAGEEVKPTEAKEILKSLEFKILNETPLNITVEVPYFRTDVVGEADLIEEVLRIRTYEKIPLFLPNRPAPKKLEFPERDLEDLARDTLTKLGFNEVVSQQIIDEKDTIKTGLFNENKIIRLQNSWNEELNIMRPETLSGQLKYGLSYQKHGVTTIKIFEVGKSYTQTGTGRGLEKYKETRKIAFSANLDFLSFKSFVETFLKELGNFEPVWVKEKLVIYKEQKGAILKTNGEEIGEVGELKQALLSNFNLEGTWCHACFYTQELLKQAKPNPASGVKTSIENLVAEDKTFEVDARAEAGKLLNRLRNEMDPSTKIKFVGIFENDELKKQNKKNITFNFKFALKKAKEESEKLKNLIVTA
ncbi:MAG: phenylalanine--tRNA ligase beta subunit-related protein [Patescibacteria group bacterium]|nr:phenylalanine--tRNA ligase beta subunit-related protein [Patescibacteria group bacterium]